MSLIEYVQNEIANAPRQEILIVVVIMVVVAFFLRKK